jgi:hypothetical protein
MDRVAENAKASLQGADEHSVMASAIEQEQNRRERGNRKRGHETIESPGERLERREHAPAQGKKQISVRQPPQRLIGARQPKFFIAPRFAHPNENWTLGRRKHAREIDALRQLKERRAKTKCAGDRPQRRVTPQRAQAIAKAGASGIRPHHQDVSHERATEERERTEN